MKTQEVKTIDMGLNMRPAFTKYEEVIKKFKEKNDIEMIKYWENVNVKSLELKEQIEKEVELNGSCQLSWSCMGETLHNTLAYEWSKAMENYNFEIDRFYCLVSKN